MILLSGSMKPWDGAELMAMGEAASPLPEYVPQSYDDDRINALIES